MTEQSGRRHAGGSLDQTILGDLNSGNVLLPDADLSSDDATADWRFINDVVPAAGPSLDSEGNRGAGLQIVFIDSSVPDAEILAAGVKPGVLAVLLDPGQDGVQQIADYLSTHHFHDLAAIDIVAHGADGVVELGNAQLSVATIADYQAQLAEIGSALAPDGAIQLYGCDVAQDASGVAFLQQLSQATGGANIAAASHLVGSAAEGGSWNLNVDVGTVDVAGPFTDAAVSAYPDLLSVTANQIFVAISNGQTGAAISGNRIEQFGVSGSTIVSNSTVDLADASQPGNTSIVRISGLAVDTILNKYYAAVDNKVTGTLTIQQGNIIGGGTLSTLYTIPFPDFGAFNTGGTIGAVLGGLAIDVAGGSIYYALDVEDDSVTGINAANTGIWKLSVNGGSPTLVNGTTFNLTNPRYLALDTADNLLFFDDSLLAGGGFPAVNNLDALNLTTGTVTVLHSFGTGTSTFLLQGMDINTTSRTLYLTITDTASTSSSDNEILSTSFSVSGSGSSASASIGALTTLYSGSGAFSPSDIVIDTTHGIFYASGSQPVTSPGAGQIAGVFEGSLSGGTTLTSVLSMSTLLGTPTTTSSPAFNTSAPQLVLLQAPVINASGAVTFAQGGSAVTVDSGLTVSDPDSPNLASATVTITGFLTGDTLTATDFGSITHSFTSGTLTLSGNDSLAHYIQELDSVKFNSSASNITQNGSDASRSINWTVSDGVITSATPTTTVNIHAAFLNASGTATFTGGGSAVPLDSGLVVGLTGASDFTSATVTIGTFVSGDILSVGTPGGLIANYNTTTGTLTLSGTASVATYKTALDSVAYSFTSGGDPTHGNSRSSSSISWLVNDGTVVSPTGSSSLSLVHVAPSISATGTAATFTGGGPAIALGDTVSITDPDSAGALTSATVIIGSGFINGDSLIVGTLGGLSSNFVNGNTLTLTGSASIATYDAALDSLQYTFTAGGDPTGGAAHSTSRTLSWVANDGVANSNTVTTTLNIQHVAASVTAGASASYAKNGPAVLLDPSLTVSDIDSGDILTSATVSISSGLVSGDTLNFSNQLGITGTLAAGVLTLHGTTTVENYQTALRSITYSSSGDPTQGSRTITWVVNDGAVNSSPATSNLSTACYLTGTLILTDRGEVPVETLAIGDRVVTLSGEAKPIKWIGHRVYGGRFVARNRILLPILIRKDALADGLPRRDLFVSPQHAMFLNDVLVPAEMLLNGASIVRYETTGDIEYFHIELDEHGVIFAEGAAAETFVDCDNRNMFHNAHEFDRLYPDAEGLTWDFCAPRVTEGDDLARIRFELDARLEIFGFTTTFDPDLQLIVDGRPVVAEHSNGNMYRFRLDEPPGDVRIVSRSSVPAEIDVSSTDIRQLGVNVSRIILENDSLCIVVEHSNPSLADGFHEAEATHRWTDGDARIPAKLLKCFEGDVTIGVEVLNFSLTYRDTSHAERWFAEQVA